MGIEEPADLYLSDVADATTFTLQDPETGIQRHIVYMIPNDDGQIESEAALLAHEAVHIADAYLDYIGEHNPAPEEHAYVVQYISNYLIGKHFNWKARRLSE